MNFWKQFIVAVLLSIIIRSPRVRLMLKKKKHDVFVVWFRLVWCLFLILAYSVCVFFSINIIFNYIFSLRFKSLGSYDATSASWYQGASLVCGYLRARHKF